jgi:undecaprenyl-diphosphatase
VLGSLEVTLAVALLAGLGLLVMGRRIELAVLAVGIAISFLLVPEIKDWVQRPRPPDPLTDAKGWSFPSGHATHSVVYTWLAVTVAFRLVPKYSHRTVVIVSGLVLTALVGLTRVYLRVHWMSDVSSGWALCVAALTIAGAFALVASHIRDNGEEDGNRKQTS